MSSFVLHRVGQIHFEILHRTIAREPGASGGKPRSNFDHFGCGIVLQQTIDGLMPVEKLITQIAKPGVDPAVDSHVAVDRTKNTQTAWGCAHFRITQFGPIPHGSRVEAGHGHIVFVGIQAMPSEFGLFAAVRTPVRKAASVKADQYVSIPRISQRRLFRLECVCNSLRHKTSALRIHKLCHALDVQHQLIKSATGNLVFLGHACNDLDLLSNLF